MARQLRLAEKWWVNLLNKSASFKMFYWKWKWLKPGTIYIKKNIINVCRIKKMKEKMHIKIYFITNWNYNINSKWHLITTFFHILSFSSFLYWIIYYSLATLYMLIINLIISNIISSVSECLWSLIKYWNIFLREFSDFSNFFANSWSRK